MEIDKLTGLEIIRGIINGDIPHPPMAETIPMKFTSAEAGSVVFEVIADERHTNPLGGVHGGFAATVLDSVTGCAVHTMLEAGRGYGTIDLAVKMLKPVPKNTVLRAEGKVLSVSKSLGVSEGKLLDDDGRLLAYASCTCMLMCPKSE